MSELALRVRGLKRHFGGIRAVDGIDVEVEMGSFVGLIGPNGCGKTTAFNLISNLLARDAGEVEVMGRQTSGLASHRIARMGLTRTFQTTRLWTEMTVLENLLVPPPDQGGTDPIRSLLGSFRRQPRQRLVERAYEVLGELGVQHMADTLAGELSGGQSKLVDIGRALMGEPTVLLLDEPVAGVAGPLAEHIFHLVRRMVTDHGLAVLVIEHNMDFVLRAGVDHIVVMDQGRVLMQGTTDEVRAHPEVIEAYLGGEAPAEVPHEVAAAEVVP